MKKLFVWMILLVFLLTACNTPTSTGEQHQHRVLHYGITNAIEHLNPILTEEGHSELIALLYRGLMKQTENNEVTGDLAKTYDVSEDGLHYSFTLHEAFWHDGEPLTAHDVAFTLQRILDEHTASPYYSDFQTVAHITVEDARTLHIEVSEPTPTLLHKLKVGIVPQHIFEGQSMLIANENKAPIGNGPYKLTAWQADGTLQFEANEAFYGKIPAIKHITVYTKLDENTKLLRLQTGELDLTMISPQQKDTVAQYDNVAIRTFQTADYRALQFNQHHPQLADVNVRRAINYFIDRSQLQQLVLFGTGEQAYGPLQRSFARLDIDTYRFEPQRAKQLLQQAGYEKSGQYFEKNGESLHFDIVAPITDPVRVSLATVIVEQLQAYGVNAQLQTKDWSTITIEQEDSFMIGWGSEDDPDTHTYRVFHSSEHAPNGYNYALVTNKHIDTALEQAKFGTPDARRAAYHEFQQHLAQEMAFSFLLYVDGVYAISSEISGMTSRTLGHNGFGLMWNIEEWSWVDEDA